MPPDPRFQRGARQSPLHRTMYAPRFRPIVEPPAQFCRVPAQLSMWGNDRYGDCVTAEEAFKCAAHDPEIFIPDEEVIRWARAHGVLNGADLTEVMDAMIREGFKVGAQLYNDGPYAAVDYSNQTLLKAAIFKGTVKNAIAADALPSGAGNHSGWYVLGDQRSRVIDHSTSYTGYGPAGYLYDALKVPLPPALDKDQAGYLLYTWATIGFVDHAWIMGATAECWLRQPNTVGVPPLPPEPDPNPQPGPGPGPTPMPWTECLLNLFRDLATGANVVTSFITFVTCLFSKGAIDAQLYGRCMEAAHRGFVTRSMNQQWTTCLVAMLGQIFAGVGLPQALGQFLACLFNPPAPPTPPTPSP